MDLIPRALRGGPAVAENEPLSKEAFYAAVIPTIMLGTRDAKQVWRLSKDAYDIYLYLLNPDGEKPVCLD